MSNLFKIKLKKFNEKLDKGKIAEFQDEYVKRKNKELETRNLLTNWKHRIGDGGDLKIIHTISGSGSVSSIGRNTISPFSQRRIEDVLSGWDVISCSCVMKRLPTDTPWKGGVGALCIELDLDVPIQNILGVHPHDVNFPNFAGREGGLPQGRILNSYELADSIFQGKAKPSLFNFIMDKPYNSLLPAEVIYDHLINCRSSYSKSSYNEILVIGRSGINIHPGFPPTNKIKLNGISYRPNYSVIDKILGGQTYHHQELRLILEDLLFIKKLLQMNNLEYFNSTLSTRGLANNVRFNTILENAGFERHRTNPQLFKVTRDSFA
ncbi:hypothetical protein F3J28_04730 [Enterobacter sp. Ap-1006]|uniref:hypothetical protein n=1 Tax=Enterobacter sp. Ap-1006 TaxID=2608345 RepID=UPI0014237BFB|nr:hypothetical protein [Enterobacter sp. Ap-1006]NIF47072.1 hypothetical protein [Enterobacter sp. Ap-1006]